MKPMYALHKDARGQTLAAKDFSQEFELTSWVRNLDLRDGDSITFNEVATRAPKREFVPAFIETPAAEPATAADDQPF